MKSIIYKSLIISVALFSFLLVDTVFNMNIVMTDAQARVGRPLTPGSVAGVARRTTRRTVHRRGVHGGHHGVHGGVVHRPAARVIRRTAVLIAVLPAGCPTVVVNGTSLYHCGGVYYQTSGTQYVVVNLE